MTKTKTITQGTTITLTDVNTGKTSKYVIWDVVVDAITGVWKMELKTPHPENRVEYVLKAEPEDKPQRKKSAKTPNKTMGSEEE